MGQSSRPVSTVPVWLGVAAGFVIAMFHPAVGPVITVPLGFVFGYLFYSRNRAHEQHKELAARIGDLLERVSLLEYSIKRLRSEPDELAPEPAVTPATPTETIVIDAPVGTPPVQPATAMDFEFAQRTETAAPATVQPASPARPPAPPPPRSPSFVERAVNTAKAWLLGGNTVARVGLLVLFVGVAFLLRYVAERTEVPIELRLVGVALGALALLVVGWRLRVKRPGYAITLQGGAIGILYLTVFAALRLYEVLPALPAFALLALLAVFSAVLAVAQNARALAALGATGGFLAPILVSTGAGRIEILLSFYLLLNFGVLGISWFRAWRELNWIGFAFTFGVLGFWVAQRYTPDDYLVAQGFLIAFWLLFLGVSLLYALRQPQSTRGIFDTTLMFALPLAAFGIQSRLTEGVQLALAATVAAAAYLLSSALLIRRRDTALRVLTEASFGVGVAFLTLAVPLAASAQWTAAAWALEGLALLWVGMRQQRILPIMAGLALHVAGAFALLRALDTGAIDTLPQLSGFTLNLAVFAATAFASALLLMRSAATWAFFGRRGALIANAAPWALRLIGWAWVVVLAWQPLAYPWYVAAWCALALGLMVSNRRRISDALSAEWVAGVAIIVLAWLATEARADAAAELSVTSLLRLAVTVTAIAAALLSLAGGARQRTAAAALLAFGVLVWLSALLAETWSRVDDPFAAAQVALMIVAVTAAALVWLAHRLKWAWPWQLSWAYFVAHIVLAATVIVWALDTAQMPSRFYGWIVWPLAWAFFYVRLAWEERAAWRAPDNLQAIVHVAGLWLLTAMIAAEFALRIDTVAGAGWFHAAWGAIPALALWLIVHYATRWPMRVAPVAYASVGAPGLAIYALAWIGLTSVLSAGDPAPLPYVPLLNPLDLASLLALAAVLRWLLFLNTADHRPNWQRPVRFALGAAAFISLNAAALRAVHFLAGVPWDPDALAGSLLVQAVLSLLWTTTAMALMVFAHRRTMRGWWMVGAALLGAVVVKLFFVDLSGQGTIERIVSFVGVGVLILLIGYLAPVPPAAAQPARATA